VQVHKLQLGEDARCDKNDKDDNNSNEMVERHERFFDEEKKRMVSMRKHE